MIYVAAAAPAMAASAPLTIPMTPSNWTVTTTGTAVAGGATWNAAPPYFNTDGAPAANSTYTATITAPVSVVAGKTYTFTVGYTLTPWNTLNATGWASVNGTALTPGISTAVMTGSTRVNGTFTVTYTASSTGTINFSLTTRIVSTSSTTQGDDIRWTSLTYVS